MKKSIYLIILIFIFMFIKPFQVEAIDPIRVLIDYNDVNFSSPPIIVNGNTLVEFRPIFEKLGFTLSWNSRTKTILGDKEGTQIELQIGNKIAKVNGQDKELPVAPSIINNHTFVPTRFIAENSGSEVEWQPEYRYVQIYTLNCQLYNAVNATNVAYHEAYLEPSSDANVGDSLKTYNESIKTVQKKLAEGADPNYIPYDGDTLLFSTASTGSPELLEILLKSGADLNLKSDHGDEFKDLPNKPLLEAIFFYRDDNVEVLLNYNPNLLNNTGDGQSVVEYMKHMTLSPRPEYVIKMKRIIKLLNDYIQKESLGNMA